MSILRDIFVHAYGYFPWAPYRKVNMLSIIIENVSVNKDEKQKISC